MFFSKAPRTNFIPIINPSSLPLHATFQIIQTIPTIQLQCIEHILFFIILTHHISNQSSAASCIQLSSPSISNDTLFYASPANQIKTSNNNPSSSAVNFFSPNFSYNAKRPNPVGLKLQTVLIHAL
jgi:hypothetical protein